MYLPPRHAEIIQMAKDNGRVLVDDLASHFGVTPQTIRKDLNDLCDQRMLTRAIKLARQIALLPYVAD